jgi:hypothetical protein
MDKQTPILKSQVAQRISGAPASKVWTPSDFLDLGQRDAVDKTLQRMVSSQALRRIDRGLYDQPRTNQLTGSAAVADYISVIDAVGRRDQVRILLDGMAAANDLGLTNAVPGQVIIHTDGRLRPIVLDNITIQFKLTAPSKLFWAGRPAMRIVQSLYWLRDELKSYDATDLSIVSAKIRRILADPKANLVRDDLILGMNTLPSWMQNWIRQLLGNVALPTRRIAMYPIICKRLERLN